MKRKIILRGMIVVFLLLVIAFGVAEQLGGKISSQVMRLHIVANSDEDVDQQVKLLVRDAVIGVQGEIFPQGIKKELSRDETEKIKAVAQEVLCKQGMTYGVEIEVGNWYFPTARYENITLPAGNYDGVRVILGDGKGKNWWCVMYPPLCFTKCAVGSLGEDGEKLLRENLGEFCYKIIADESIKTVPAIKLVETLSAIKEKFR